ncbi:MAG: long-chain-fatty-acid--CoA ligase [Acidobacteriota bacterium]
MEKIWQKHYDPEVPESISYPEVTLNDIFRRSVEDHPGGVATIFVGAKIKYGDLGKLVDRFAAGLAGLGVKQGDRVAIILPNLPAYPIAHFAVLKLGAILVPTNPLYVARELEHQLNDAGAETVIVLDQLYPRLLEVRHQTRVKRLILIRVKDFLPGLVGFLYGLKNKSHAKTDEAAGVYTYRDLMRRSSASTPEARVSPEDTAIFLYTGGTTGVSKGAVLTHRNLVVNVYQTRKWLATLKEKKEVILCVLPFFHSYGMTTGMHLAVLSRSTMLLQPRFELKDVIKQIKKHRPTIFCGIPSMYNAINRSPGLSGSDVSSVRLCVSGGAALPGEVQKQFESLTGGRLVEGYGLSECSPLTHVNPIHGRRKNGTIGVPVSDTDARVLDPETREPLPAGQVGELAVKGPQVMKGYWQMPEESEQVLSDGWLYTGDMAVMDEDGFFTIVDRKKDLIISAGMNIYPREIEEVLHQHPKVREAAVVGAPSSVREEIVKAYVVIEPGQELTKNEVIQFCRDRLAKFKVPRQVEFVQELPKSTVGKILKRELRSGVLKPSTVPSRE